MPHPSRAFCERVGILISLNLVILPPRVLCGATNLHVPAPCRFATYVARWQCLCARCESTIAARMETHLPQNTKLKISRFRLGCLVFAGLFVLLIIVGGVTEYLDPSLSVDGTAGKLHLIEYATGSAKNAGWHVAEKVWQTAHKHPELQEIDVEIELYVAGGGLVDKYGNKIPGPYIMGTIPVHDLEEVRRYVDEDSYTWNNQADYAEPISNLKYSYLFEKH
jgi:hypothetical protein